MMKVELTEVPSRGHGKVRVDFTSGASSLVHPDTGNADRESTAAEELTTVLKQALREAGMTVIEKTFDMGSTGDSGPAHVQVVVQEHNAYDKSGHRSAVVIKAEPDWGFEGEFSPKAMTDAMKDALEKMAEHLKGAATANAVHQRIADVAHEVSTCEKKIDEVLGYDPEAASGRPQEAMREPLAEAIGRHISIRNLSGDARETTINAMVDGILGTANTPAWPRIDDVEQRGTANDPLRMQINGELATHIPAHDLRNYIAGEVAEEVYSTLNRAHSASAQR
jgi:hypothetical protein